MDETGAQTGASPIAAGPVAAERWLIEQVLALLDEARADPALLVQPIRIVVPSASLREHLAARLTAGRGALAGVRLQTLNGLAREVLASAGDRVGPGDRLFPVLVRRAAREQPALRAVLEGLEDGYGAATGAVADLLDAGFMPDVPAHGEALTEALQEAGLPPETQRRVAAVVATAAATAEALAAHGLERAGGRLRRAAERLEGDASLLPARATFVHGFADATGAVSDLLEALTRACGAHVVIDLAPDPAQPERSDFGVAFTERLRSRLGIHQTEASGGEAGTREFTALRAVGTDAEVRGVAERISALIDAGVRPERIGVVARDSAPYAIAVRTQFGRLGIPFAAPGTPGPPSGRGRLIHGLLALLAERAATPADRWLDLLARLSRGERADLRLGFHAMGSPRLADVANLDVQRLAADAALDQRGDYALPARSGLVAETDERAAHAARRRLSGTLLSDAIAAARAAHECLTAWPARASMLAHAARLRALLRDELAWGADEPLAAVERALASLDEELGSFDLEYEEFVLVVRGVLRDLGNEDFGSAGAGVRFYGVVEARSHTFDHLFLLGVNRDVFPRPLLDDPLLPDSVRRRLEPLLPEIPLKSRVFEEEHYLFAQLMAASPRVVLSWQVANDEGRARTVSPFVERLRSAGVLTRCDDVAGAHAAPRAGVPLLCTAQEAALLEGLHGAPERFGELLTLAAGEVAQLDLHGEGVAADRLAAGRQAVLRELGDRPGIDELGPYFGFLGAVRHSADVRRADLYVTHVERLIRCPWQLFLTRLLRIEPPPNALDTLPDVTPLLVGNLVHRVLERIVADAFSASAARREGIAWPAPDVLEVQLGETAAALLREEGVGVAGFERFLVEVARPLVLAARTLEWPDASSSWRCVAAEADGSVQVGLPPRTVHYRVDRVDAQGDRQRLIDYKTGSSETQAKLPKDVARGKRLQAAAYAFGSGGEGRYLYLAAEDLAKKAVVEAQADDAELHEAFEEAVSTALLAFDAGAFFPRLTEAGGTQPAAACKHCEVREACLQGDAGARARIAAWAERERGESPAESQALALWRLGGEGAR